jgi:hypothetical protein
MISSIFFCLNQIAVLLIFKEYMITLYSSFKNEKYYDSSNFSTFASHEVVSEQKEFSTLANQIVFPAMLNFISTPISNLPP